MVETITQTDTPPASGVISLEPDPSSVIDDKSTGLPSTEPIKDSQPTAPQGLEKFASESGQVDSDKLGKSYLESEKRQRQLESELAQTRDTLAALTKTPATTSTTPQEPTAEDSEAELKELVSKGPRKYFAEVMEELSQPLAQQLSKAALEASHPEMKDENFRADLASWMKTLPPTIQEVDVTLDGADYLLKLFKREKQISKEKRDGSNPSLPSTEAPSIQSTGGRTFSRAKIRDLMTGNPKEYARLMPEIEAAYREKRVVA